MKNSLLLATLTTIGAPGCYFDFGDTPSEAPSPIASAFSDGGIDSGELDSGWDEWDVGPAVSPAPGENLLAVSGVRLNGQLGDVASDVSAETYIFQSYASRDHLFLDIRGRSQSGVLMNLLSIHNSRLLEVGETYRSDETTPRTNVFVSVLGCSGPDDGRWNVDVSSETLTLDVREGPEDGSAELFYTANFRNGNVVEGSFVLPLTP